MITDERRAVICTTTARRSVRERRVRRVLGFERAGIRYVPTRPSADARLRDLAADYPLWGVPRSHWRRQREGLTVSYKRVERWYRLGELPVRTRHRNRRRRHAYHARRRSRRTTCAASTSSAILGLRPPRSGAHHRRCTHVRVPRDHRGA